MIEGFYGRPWSHEERLWLVERMSEWRMNTYVYAPKDDPLHRDRWRDPYDAEALRRFQDLIARGLELGVHVGFALSPGQSVSYASSEDRQALAEKFGVFRELGCRLFVLALDDVPSSLIHAADQAAFASLADAHVALMHELIEKLGPDADYVFVPTDYLGTEPTDYLETLGEKLDPAVPVAWTGRTVVSPSIRMSEAAARAATLRRRLLLWDNVPVSDGPMRPMLHLGPYAGRDPALAEHVSGVWLNPMQHVRASAIALRTAAAYLREPDRYEAELEWHEALAESGEGDPEAFKTFARAHRFSPIWSQDRDTELEAALVRLRSALAGQGDSAVVLAELEELVSTRQQASERIRENLADKRLVAEIEPWLVSHQRETRRMELAVSLLHKLDEATTASERAYAFFGFEGGLTRLPHSECASYGPRRVLYPQLASMRDDSMCFGTDPALIRNRCLADEFVDLAESRALDVTNA